MRHSDVTLEALQRDRKRLHGIAVRAKAKLDAYLTAGTVLLETHNELIKLHNELKHKPAEMLAALDKLDAKRKKLQRLLKCDVIKMSDKECDSQFALDDIDRAIQYHKFYNSQRTT